MRLLVTSSPLLGHLFPLLPLVWAARAAGHDVLVATGGPAAEAAVDAGLPVVDCGGARPAPPSGAPVRTGGERPNRGTPVEFAIRMLADQGDAMAECALAAARRWRPDRVLHSSLDGVGPLIGARMGIPVIRHTFGMGVQPREMTDGVRRAMRAWRGIDPSAHAPAATVDPGPAEARLAGAAPGLACRYIPHNGGGTLPGWALEPSATPRVVITMGTVLPGIVGESALDPILAACADLPVDARVLAGGWIPLSALLPTCAAVVHHGGSGTAATAIAHGVPQVLLPRMADQFDIAEAVAKSGAGLALMPESSSPPDIRSAVLEALGNPDITARAHALRDANAALPPPAAIVDAVLG